MSSLQPRRRVQCAYDRDCPQPSGVGFTGNASPIYCDGTGQCVSLVDAYPASVLNTYRYADLGGCTEVGPFEYYALQNDAQMYIPK
jgi:hypothetical protein